LDSGNRNSRLAALMFFSCDWVSPRYNKTALALQVKNAADGEPTSAHPEMVDFGSGQGRSEIEIDGVAVGATACVVALRRG